MHSENLSAGEILDLLRILTKEIVIFLTCFSWVSARDGNNWSSDVWCYYKAGLIYICSSHCPSFCWSLSQPNTYGLLQAKFFINVLAEPPEVVIFSSSPYHIEIIAVFMMSLFINIRLFCVFKNWLITMSRT